MQRRNMSCDGLGVMIVAGVAVIFGVTMIIGFSAPNANADTTSSITVTVPAACSLSTTSGSGETYNISILNGQYKNDIGTTTITAICNDKESLSVYAVGYSNDTVGNTNLVSSNTSSPVATNIATGTATSGDVSNWAMKLEAVAGTGIGTGANAGINSATPSIENGYGNFSAVPSQQTKVATFASVTETINSISIKSTYAVYASPTQGVGSYTGKVKYTVVYPASNLPVGSVTTASGYVSYNPNSDGVVDKMGDQSINATDTEITLWASNFQRKGYGFVGWSDKYDWVLNANDANGNGTGVNAGYHIYGPNQTINITAGQYSGDNNGLSLYAVWAKSTGILQTWNNCSFMSIGQVTALTDNRDNDTYAVAKLADGKCWMVENLRLGSDTAINLTTSDSALSSNLTLPASTNSFTTSNYTTIQQNSTNTLNPVANMTTPNANIYSYGNYYSWAAAIGTTTAYSSGNVSTSICPKGWHLPTGATGGEFSTLDSAMGGTGSYQSNATASNRWRTYPVNAIYSGYWNSGSPYDRGSLGYYWSSTTIRYVANYMGFDRGGVGPGTSNYNKYYGLQLRCLVSS